MKHLATAWPPSGGPLPVAGPLAWSPSMSSEASTLLGLLADDDRLRAVAALVLGPGPASASEVADAAGLDVRRAAKALTRLAGAGLVDQTGDSYVLRPERFREALDSLGRPEEAADSPHSGQGPDVDRILRIFVRDGRLVQIPAVHGKRLVVLDWLAGMFEPGRAYAEKEVNEILGRVHDDYAALRRYLVDEGFLHRRDGFYWRAGGTFEVDWTDPTA
jgi:hypothetical protein